MSLTLFTGCRSVDTSPKISLYSDHSLYIYGSYEDGDYKTFPNYRLSTAGDVPYVELSDYLGLEDVFDKSVDWYFRGNGVFTITRDNIDCVEIDVKNDLLTLRRLDYLLCGYNHMNNGYGYDTLNDFGNEAGKPIHGSEKTKVLGKQNVVVLDMKKYGFDFVEENEKCYFPFHVLSNVIKDTGVSIVYNGIDFYSTSLVCKSFFETDYDGFINAGFYSGNTCFYYNRILFTPIAPAAGEEYRFIYEDKYYGDYNIFVLYGDGTGKGFYAFDKYDTFDDREKEYSFRLVTWQKTVADIRMKIQLYSKDGVFVSDNGVTRIPFEKGYTGEKRSESLIKYNYNLLRLQFEVLYGLSKERGVDDFDAFVTANGIKEALLSADPEEYDCALCTFVTNLLDDAHSAYWFRSAHSLPTATYIYNVVELDENKEFATVTGKLYDYSQIRKNVMVKKYGYNEDDDMQGLFIEGETAVIRFDSFLWDDYRTDEQTYDESDVPMLFGVGTNKALDTCFYYLDKNYPYVKNVVFDVTCNGGGDSNAVLYLSAFFTDDPYCCLIDELTKTTYEWHYTIDLDHDGVYGQKGDTLKDKYNYYILESDGSFSGSSYLSVYAKNSGVKVIGKKDGGGCCCVCLFTDVCGSTYKISDYNCAVYKNADGDLVKSDRGVPVDIELDVEYWYDFEKLNAFLASLNA